MVAHVGGRIGPLHPGDVVGGLLRGIVRDLRGLSTPSRRWLGMLGILIAFGAYGTIRSLPPGDAVFGTGGGVEWGILISAYVLLAVTASGLCLVAGLGQVFGVRALAPVAPRAVVLATLCLLAGFGIIALDLHYPLRLVFGAVMSPSPMSPMWWMGVVYGMYLAFLLLELAGLATKRSRIARAGSLLTFATAIVAPSVLGAVFGVLVARPYWHGALAPVSLLVSALLSGSALLGVVLYHVNRLRLPGHGEACGRAATALGALLTVVLGVAIFLTAWQTIVGLYGGVPGLAGATMALVAGPLSAQFWILRVALGLILPFILLLASMKRTPGVLFAASCLTIVGLVADRLVLVNAGQIAPASAAFGIIPATYAVYTPTLVEVGVVLGAIGFVALAYSATERYLDLGSGHQADAPQRDANGPMEAVGVGGGANDAAAASLTDAPEAPGALVIGGVL